jgi:hypothetical protein
MDFFLAHSPFFFHFTYHPHSYVFDSPGRERWLEGGGQVVGREKRGPGDQGATYFRPSEWGYSAQERGGEIKNALQAIGNQPQIFCWCGGGGGGRYVEVKVKKKEGLQRMGHGIFATVCVINNGEIKDSQCLAIQALCTAVGATHWLFVHTYASRGMMDA